MAASFWDFWKKNFFTKDIAEDAIEFQPDALEIQHQPLPWWGRWGIIWMLGFFLLAIVWATIGHMDVFVTSTGKIVSRSPTVIMKPLERTVVKSIHVEIGQTVTKDQLLIDFDPVFSQSDVHKLHNEILALSAQFSRLEAEFNEKEFIPVKTDTADTLWQQSIYVIRKQLYQEKMRYFTEELNRIEELRASMEKTLEKHKEGLQTSLKIESELLRGRSIRAISMREFAEFQISRINMEAEILSLQGRFFELVNEASVRRAERDAFIEEWRENTTEEMVQVRRDLVQAQNEYNKAVQLEKYMALRAPCDAIIHEIAPVSIGTAVREAESLITLVPVDGSLEVEAEVAAKDIGKVKVGDLVRVKLFAFPFQQYGTLQGRVRNISENTFQKQQNENAEEQEQMGGSFYRARIALEDRKSNALLEHVRLIPGMEVQAEIRVGERSIITYLIYPLIKSLDESLREV